MEKNKITITYKNNENRSHVHKLIYNRNEKLKEFHLTINKKQAKAISKLGDLESKGIIKPLNVTIIKFKIYKDNKRARLSLSYTSERELTKFFYYVGFIESMILFYGK